MLANQSSAAIDALQSDLLQSIDLYDRLIALDQTVLINCLTPQYLKRILLEIAEDSYEDTRKAEAIQRLAESVAAKYFLHLEQSKNASYVYNLLVQYLFDTFNMTNEPFGLISEEDIHCFYKALSSAGIDMLSLTQTRLVGLRYSPMSKQRLIEKLSHLPNVIFFPLCALINEPTFNVILSANIEMIADLEKFLSYIPSPELAVKFLNEFTSRIDFIGKLESDWFLLQLIPALPDGEKKKLFNLCQTLLENDSDSENEEDVFTQHVLDALFNHDVIYNRIINLATVTNPRDNVQKVNLGLLVSLIAALDKTMQFTGTNDLQDEVVVKYCVRHPQEFTRETMATLAPEARREIKDTLRVYLGHTFLKQDKKRPAELMAKEADSKRHKNDNNYDSASNRP